MFNISYEKTNIPIEKWEKAINRKFMAEEIQMARVYEKMLGLTAVRETKVKFTGCQFYASNLQNLKQSITPRAEGVGEMASFPLPVGV